MNSQDVTVNPRHHTVDFFITVNRSCACGALRYVHDGSTNDSPQRSSCSCELLDCFGKHRRAGWVVFLVWTRIEVAHEDRQNVMEISVSHRGGTIQQALF